MLSKHVADTLVQVSKGTQMGDFLRLFWVPFHLSAAIEADGMPKRVKLMGEDMVVFRDTLGRVGLVDNACAHRRAPMAYARNEDCGLRCVYHGWKYDITGQCVDQPAEPANSRFKNRVRIKAYPCRERNGVIWAYMGPETDEAIPDLPNVEWNLVDPEQVHVTIRVQETNWLQALEGDIDSAHAGFLHGRVDNDGRMKRNLNVRDMRPTFDVVQKDWGVSIASRRIVSDEDYYWRVNQFVFPWFTFSPPQSVFPELTGHAWVPMDDEHTLVVTFSYVPDAPLYPKTRALFEEGYKGRETGHPSRHAYRTDNPGAPYAGYWTRFNAENDFLIDAQEQKTTWFSGIPGLWVQDTGCQAGLGPIIDRTLERLGASDAGIVVARHSLLDASRAYRESGTVPAGVTEPDQSMIRAVAIRLPRDQEVWQAAGEFMQARLGAGFGYTP